MTDCLEDVAFDVRRDAAVALGNIGPDALSAVPALVKLTATAVDPELLPSPPDLPMGELEDHQAARHAAVDALGKIAPAAKEAIAALSSSGASREN